MTFRLPATFPLLPRRRNASKGDFGHALIVAGSPKLVGAARLAALAALRSGSGLTTLAFPGTLGALRVPDEATRLELPATGERTISAKAAGPLLAFIERRKINALAIGPGLSVNPSTLAFVRDAFKHSPAPVVLDADGLNAFKGRAKLLAVARSTPILTPHAVEFKRLFGCPVPDALKDRVVLAKRIADSYDGVLVLKGLRTVVSDGRRVYVNVTGNPGLAKGGSGDVLTGMIVAFLAQHLDPFQAAVWAVYFHGRAADLAVREKGELGLLATDVIDALPKAFKRR